jgi:hypothetical protein
MEEVKEKQALKRSRLMAKPPKAKKPRVATKKVSKKATAPKRPKSKTQAQLKKELDSVFSIYIRTKYADTDGMVACYTCGKVMHWKKIQNGHFISRTYLATRFHENNCRPQCWGCNGFGNGKPLDFEENLKRELSPEYVEELKKLRHSSVKYDRHWYTEMINNYKNELS